MTDQERYKCAFDAVASSGMRKLEVSELMQDKKKLFHLKRAAAAAVAAALAVSGSAAAYAANVGGIQRTVQVWVEGDLTTATITFDDVDESGASYSYSVTYQSDDGSIDGLAFYDLSDEDVTVVSESDDGMVELTLAEADGLDGLTAFEVLTIPQVEYREDGTVWVYYLDQTLDITGMFQDGMCYLTLVNGDETLYLTVRADGGYAVSSDKYETPALPGE